ncbi:MAG TPA: hypothetical protein DCW68_03155 [Rhodospirillaceae bacterium]|nr:MAG: hypothetical protein A2018_06130 [Alphaproteobacteria bacterium GWF2_58_20]HAU29090.1 hypothetical protein [Rhodospirillaceae bacterium]
MGINVPNAPLASPIDLSLATPAMEKAAEQFEAVFMSQMLAPMFDGNGSDGLFGGGKAEETFRSLLIDQYGNKIATRHATGIAEAVLREMIKIQETQS